MRTDASPPIIIAHAACLGQQPRHPFTPYMLMQVHASMRGIVSLAKETNQLELGQDASGEGLSPQMLCGQPGGPRVQIDPPGFAEARAAGAGAGCIG